MVHNLSKPLTCPLSLQTFFIPKSSNEGPLGQGTVWHPKTRALARLVIELDLNIT